MQTILKSQNLGLLVDIPPVNGRSQFDSLLEKAYEADPFPLEIIALLREGQRTCKQFSLNECEIREERLYYRNRLYVPKHDEQQQKSILASGFTWRLPMLLNWMVHLLGP